MNILERRFQQVSTTSNTYTCEACGETYEKSWSDAEANKEAQQIFGTVNASEDLENNAIICDICFKKLLPNN